MVDAEGGYTIPGNSTLARRIQQLAQEELIDDCLDLTVFEAEKRGPALKNRLVGDAELHKGLLNHESLRAADGVKYFRDTLRPLLFVGAQSVFF